jgi:hypothetical protein
VTKPTGKQLRAVAKAERRVMRAARTEQLARTPTERFNAQAEGLAASQALLKKQAAAGLI